MTESKKLLADYVNNGSEPAFRELVNRYVDLVYSAAVRLVNGDTHLAQDVTQMAFVDLARKAGTLSQDVMLGGWLHRHTCFVAATVMRAQRRRQSRERQAVEMNTLQSESNLAKTGPILDETINQLGAQDRAAILLRFFEQRDFRSIGAALGSNEDAARMRVKRALEKLHELLKARGVTSSAAVLGTALASQAITAAPAGLAASISAAALAGAGAGTGTILTVLKLMSMTQLKSGSVIAVVIAAAATSLLIQHQAQVKMRDENLALSRQIQQLKADNESLASRLARISRQPAPRLPAPPIQTALAPTGLPAEDLQRTNLYSRFSTKVTKLTSEQIESFLKANRRNAASLLAGFRTTGDAALLEEAMKKYPQDPQVAFEAAFKNDSTPEEKRQWLENFKTSAPDNALANYLSALDYLKAGQSDQAIQELVAASGKQQFQDYSVDRVQNDEEAFLSAGYSPAEAKVVSSLGLELPQLAQIKNLGLGLGDIAQSYQQSGDDTSAQAALQMAAKLGQRYSNPAPGEAEVSQFVGIAIQQIALGAMDPNSPYGSDGQTVQNQLDQLAQQRTTMKDVIQQFQAVAPMMSDQDWISYKDRSIAFGEQAAEQWAIGKYGQQ
jgi:RNA polymerase sigma factor (sigma-70 family)